MRLCASAALAAIVAIAAPSASTFGQTQPTPNGLDRISYYDKNATTDGSTGDEGAVAPAGCSARGGACPAPCVGQAVPGASFCASPYGTPVPLCAAQGGPCEAMASDGCGQRHGLLFHSACGDCDTVRWILASDLLLLNRYNTNTNTTAITRRVRDNSVVQSTGDLRFDFAGGPRFDLIRQDCDWGVEAAFFQIDAWHAFSDGAQPEPVFFGAPGIAVTAPTGSGFGLNYLSKLYSSELNLRRLTDCDVTFLLGFRWAELLERFDATRLTPAVLGVWQTDTSNDLYGLQIGADTKLWEHSNGFRIDASVKAGVYFNHAQQRSESILSANKVARTQDVPALLGEVGVVAVYQITRCAAVRGGYQAMWLDTVALAPDQLNVTNLTTGTGSVNANGALLYHGAVIGAEFSF